MGSSVDSVERLQRFRDKHGLVFPLASDADRRLGEAFGTLRAPGGSHLRDTFIIGSDGIIKAAYEKAKAKGHAAQVLEEAERLRGEGLI